MEAAQAITGPNALLRFLRASRDPPLPGGPSKIALAASAWRDPASEIPHLAEILRDWLLSAWSDGDRSSASHRLLDHAHHDLMLSLLLATGAELPAPIMSKLFDILQDRHSLSGVADHEVWSLVTRDTKSSAEVWFDVWSSMLAHLAHSGSNGGFPIPTITAIETGVLRSLQSGSSHKKAFSVLPSLVKNLSEAVGHGAPLSLAVTSATLFPLTVLKAPDPMGSVLGVWSAGEPTAAFVTHLMESFHSALCANRYKIYIQPINNRQTHETYVNAKFRLAIRHAFATCHQALSDLSRVSQIAYWRQKNSCWQSIARWGVYLATDDDWVNLLRADAAEAKAIMATQEDVRLLQVVLMCLGTTEALDHETTALDPAVIAWCIASPPQLYAQGLYILEQSLTYYQATQTEERWIELVLDGVQSLVRPSLDRHSAEAVDRLISFGPLWEARLLRILAATRHRDEICNQLRSRILTLSPLEPITTSTMVSVVAKLADALSPVTMTSCEELIAAAEASIGYATPGRTLSDVSPFREKSIHGQAYAGLLRLGRQASLDVKRRLGQLYEMPASDASSNDHLQYRRETILWFLERLPEEPSQSCPILASFIELLGRPWNRMSLVTAPLQSDIIDSDLAIIHGLASPRQLRAVLSSMLRDGHYLDTLLVSADFLELSDVPAALIEVLLDMIPGAKQFDRISAILLSMPQNQVEPAMRARLVSAWIRVDSTGDSHTKAIARRVLGHLLTQANFPLPQQFWMELCSDLESDDLREGTASLMRVVMRASMNIGEIPAISTLKVRVLFAEIAMEKKFQRYGTATRQGLIKQASVLTEELRGSEHDELRWIGLEFALWCHVRDHTASDARSTLTSGPNTPAQYRVLRLLCSNDHDRTLYMNALLESRGSFRDADAFDQEVDHLARQFDDYRSLLSQCLAQTERSCFHDAAIRAIAVMLGVRREGSGRAIRDLHADLTRVLYEPEGPDGITPAQIRAIGSLIKHRAKLLQVSDVARCLSGLTSCHQVDSIDIVCSLASSRPDLVVHVLPQLATFIQIRLASITDATGVALARLLLVLCDDRRQKSPRRSTTLASAMSKHAPALLAAYVRGHTDSTSFISPETRRLLRSSIHRVCNVIVRTQHRGREGEGIGRPYGVGEENEVEKEIWADLWLSWSKQRYRGQG